MRGDHPDPQRDDGNDLFETAAEYRIVAAIVARLERELKTMTKWRGWLRQKLDAAHWPIPDQAADKVADGDMPDACPELTDGDVLFEQFIEMRLAAEQGDADRAAELRRILVAAGWLLPTQGPIGSTGSEEVGHDR